MESPHQANQAIGRLLLAFFFLLLGWASLNQYTSSIVRKLTTHADNAVEISLRTKPGMVISYNPATSKALVTVENTNCNPKKSDCSQPLPSKFFAPKQKSRELFWEDFKQNLISWRYNPLLAIQVCWDYLTALHEKRTNLAPAEFILLSLEMMKLEPSDFAVKFPVTAKKRQNHKTPPPIAAPTAPKKAALTVRDRPLILEIFNASGKKGVAQELTQYLREQNEKGLLRVDVFQYENYPSIEKESWLEDYSGRLADVKQLGHALGINSEIRTGTAANVMCDTRIIIGKDFDMPL